MMTRRIVPVLTFLGSLLVVSFFVAIQGHAQAEGNFGAHLSGEQVVPPVSTTAQAEVRFRLSRDGSALAYRLIAANIDDVTSAHLHAGEAGTNGPVVVNLYPTATSPLIPGRAHGVIAEGTITAADFVGPGVGFPLSALIEAMTVGGVYVDIHTNAFPDGELRALMGSDTASSEPPCPSGPLFSVLPISGSTLNFVTPLGGFNPPGHTVPSDHVGIYTTEPNVPLVSPGNLHVTEITRTQYQVSPFRQGTSDYGIRYAVCGTLTGQFGHVISLASQLNSLLSGGTCEVYSTGEEQVEACHFSVDAQVSAGDALGTVGPLYLGAFDFGLYDAAHENYYINPARVISQQLHAVCAYTYFEATLEEYLLSRVGDGTRVRTDEPRCGTVEIDVAGTAQGLWVMESNPVTAGGDQSAFVSLALDPITPSTRQVLSVGPASLGPRLMSVVTQHAGRVNRAFSEVTPSDLIYCYSQNPPFAPFNSSYFVSLGLDGVLTMEKIAHVAGASPCSSVPASWTFSTNRVRFIR